MPVKNQHPDYVRMINRWKRCRDVTEGQDAVHDAGEIYLPKLKDQTPDDYRAYTMRTPFYNATWRTIAGLVGMLFRKPPKVEVPESVKELLDDVTMSGVPLQHFVQDVCEEALKLGRLGVLVDYPTAEVDGITLADAKQQNLRPMMHIYRAESIINWRTGRVNNVTVLTLLVLREQAMLQLDEFTQKSEDHYRVLDLIGGKYRVRIMRAKDTGPDETLLEIYPLMNGKALDHIPFTFLSTDDNTTEIDEPPLIDLVNVNLSHYRTSADLEHGAHYTGLPTAVISGFKPENPADKLYIGSAAAWVFPSPDASATYLEFTGQGLDALEKRLESKEKQMAVLGARMLEPQKKGVETAETASIHRKGEESMLSAASQSISLGMERALGWFCEWAGVPSDKVEFELNRDFYPAPMTDKMLSALVGAWQQGAFSSQVLFENLQFGEVIDQETTLEEEQARLADEAPRLQGQNVDPVTGEPLPPNKLPPKEKPVPAKKGGKTTITNPKGEKYTIQHGE